MVRASLAALLLAAPALAGELNPKSVAKIQREQKKATEEVAKAHGDRKPSEMSTAERKQVIREQAEAERRVLEKNGVEPKDLARYTARMSRAEREQLEAASADLEREEADAAKAKAAKADSAGQVQVQRGFSDARPVELEAKEGAPPVVEHGLPDDAK